MGAGWSGAVTNQDFTERVPLKELAVGRYDIQLVCLNGHIINNSYTEKPEGNADFCPKCGQGAITQCRKCSKPLRGYYYGGMMEASKVPRMPDSYCWSCGAAYPWTESKTKALANMIDELENLGADEKEKLKMSIKDIVAETPASKTAVLWFKKAIVKTTEAGGKLLTDALSTVAAETIKKYMGL